MPVNGAALHSGMTGKGKRAGEVAPRLLSSASWRLNYYLYSYVSLPEDPSSCRIQSSSGVSDRLP